MGRSYFVEETVGQYLSELTTKSKPLITGLLIGQCSPQRDYVILAVQTPPKDEESKSNAGVSAELSNIDEEWMTAHANQVSRMLPGGLSVLGVFTVAIPELSKEIQNTLRKLVFSVEKSVARKRLWSISEEDVSDRVVLHFCSATKKLCRTYDIQDPKSTAKPADWKYQSGLSTSWISLECTTNANIHIPLLATSSSHELEKNIRNGLTRWAKQIEEAVILINGQVKEEDADLVDGQSQKSNSRSTATVQICSGSINLKGALKCKAFIHHNKPKVKDAIKALKRDIINTLSDRCEILFEDLLMNEMTGMKSLEREYHALPCRVFAPIAGSRVLVCDYKFGDETVREVQEHFLEMLDQAVQAEDLHTVEEMSTGMLCCKRARESNIDNFVPVEALIEQFIREGHNVVGCMPAVYLEGSAVEIIPPKEFPDEIQHKQLTKETLLLKLHQNIGVVIAVAVAISAAAFSFNYFSD